MRHGLVVASSLVAVVLGSAISVAACGSSASRSSFGTGDKPDAAVDPGPTLGMKKSCEGLDCKLATDCGGGDVTTLTGKVYDPAGANPLYNVMVYIPNGVQTDKEGNVTSSDVTLDPFPAFGEQVKCDTCASVTLNPYRAALTNEKGEFTLKDVPVAKGIPIVVQVGKWRRKTTIDITQKCTDNAVPTDQ